jgi:hypothetical protein
MIKSLEKCVQLSFLQVNALSTGRAEERIHVH